MNKKSILITGAYGGMGCETAKKLAQLGFRVFAMDKSIGEDHENIIPIQADITDKEGVERAFRRISEKANDIYAIIHFAGIYMLDSLVEMDVSDFERIFKINLNGAFLVNKTFLPMMKSGSRIVITTSELAPLEPLPFTGIYAVSKSALDKYAYSLRMELQLLDIGVSVLRAGAISTGMLSVSTDALENFCQKTQLYTCNADRFRQIVNRVEARSVEPKKIANKISKILRRRNPKFSYSINRNPLLLLFNVLPKRMQFLIIKLILK